ncbi:MAG: hypothetical protein LBQ88_22115 [Treponema sp.]|jgi:hypothetical protein|nr:hypothetical protein [Treponema sp.]
MKARNTRKQTNQKFSLLTFNASFFIPLTSHFLVIFLCLIVNTALFGQKEYWIEEDGRFVQLLQWQEQENVLYYKVEIEKQEGMTWRGALSGETEDAFFEISLAPGIYRYRVQVYDLLGRPGRAADWIQFEIRLAKQPEIVRFSPEVFYLDEDTSWVLNLSGRNLTDGIEIFLQNQGLPGNNIKAKTITGEGREEEARVVFNVDELDAGQYTIHAVNPGGLETSLGTLRISYRKPVDINVSAGYRPLVPLYGLINELFETGIFPLGFYARLSYIPFKRTWGHIGIEIEPFWNYFYVKNSGYGIQAQMTGGTVYGVYQRLLSNRLMAFNFRIGGGINSVLDYHFIYSKGKTEPITILIPVISAGSSFQWFIRNPFFVEAGVDFVHMFTVDDPAPAYLRPFIGAGWRF